MVVDVGGPVSVHVGAAASLRVVVPRVHLVHQGWVEHGCVVSIVLHGVVLHRTQPRIDRNIRRPLTRRRPLPRPAAVRSRVAVTRQRDAVMGGRRHGGR